MFACQVKEYTMFSCNQVTLFQHCLLYIYGIFMAQVHLSQFQLLHINGISLASQVYPQYVQINSWNIPG